MQLEMGFGRASCFFSPRPMADFLVLILRMGVLCFYPNFCGPTTLGSFRHFAHARPCASTRTCHPCLPDVTFSCMSFPRLPWRIATAASPPTRTPPRGFLPASHEAIPVSCFPLTTFCPKVPPHPLIVLLSSPLFLFWLSHHGSPANNPCRGFLPLQQFIQHASLPSLLQRHLLRSCIGLFLQALPCSCPLSVPGQCLFASQVSGLRVPRFSQKIFLR